MSASADALRLDAQDPWPGLASYDEASRRYFHGREQEAAELVRLIRQSPLVTFYGKSGLGKTSVLQAGVFPTLRLQHFLPVHLRLDYADSAQTPLLEQAALRLRQEAELAHADAAPMLPGENLWAYLQRRETPIWGEDNYPLTPVLVFDQFEEVFSRGGDPEHVRRMLDTVADLAADRLPAAFAEDREAARRFNLQTQQYHVVLSFRSDFLPEISTWAKQANLPRHEALHLQPMSRDQAVEAVRKAGAEVIEPGVEAQIVDFLLQREGGGTGRGEVEPVLLSLCCYQLNRKRERPKRIDAELLKSVGKGILADFYQEAVRKMDPRVARFIEEHLILGDRYRNPYPRDVALASGELKADELELLTRNRLLRLDPQGDELRIELIHDRLVGVVRDSRDARRAAEAQERERAAAELREAEERRSAEQREQVERERERAESNERERARVARWRNGLVVALVGVCGLAGWLWKAMGDLAVARDDLEQTAESLNQNLAQATQALEKTSSELADTQVKLAAALKGQESAAEAQRRSEEAKVAEAAAAEALKKAEEAKKQEEQNRVVPTGQTLRVGAWRLSSGGCNRGPVSVWGPADFSVSAPKNGQVTVSERFEVQQAGFKVSVTGSVTARVGQACYELPTRGEWSGKDGRRFRTEGLDRVCLKGDEPTSAYILRIRTNCDG